MFSREQKEDINLTFNFSWRAKFSFWLFPFGNEILLNGSKSNTPCIFGSQQNTMLIDLVTSFYPCGGPNGSERERISTSWHTQMSLFKIVYNFLMRRLQV